MILIFLHRTCRIISFLLQIYCLDVLAKWAQISYINPTQPILVCHIPSDILMGRNCKARVSKARPGLDPNYISISKNSKCVVHLFPDQAIMAKLLQLLQSDSKKKMLYLTFCALILQFVSNISHYFSH